MQREQEEASSSTMDPWSLFLYGMKAPMTREKYRGRLAKFFDFIGLTEDTMEEREDRPLFTLQEGEGWRVTAHNGGGTEGQLRVWAVCLYAFP